MVGILYFIIAAAFKDSRRKKTLAQVLLLLSGYAFYCYLNLKFIPILLYVTVITYLSGVFATPGKKSFYVFLVLEFVPLIAYKALSWSGSGILLPLGISFFTLQAATYTVGVWRGEFKGEKNPVKIALLVSFFPTVSSGPIQRAGKLLPQFDDVKGFDYDRVTDGMKLYAFGLFKKLVIADNIAIYINEVQKGAFSGAPEVTGLSVLMSAILYSFMLYMDFSGYSDIVIGCGRILGFDMGSNFDHPYLSRTVAEFWRRWHISLSSWLRDYVYIPLGGSRKGKFATYRNTLIVFFVSGLWHGNGWQFVVWGLLHGAFICFERALNLGKKDRRVWGTILTFVAVSFAWMFFAGPDVGSVIVELQRLGSIPVEIGRLISGQAGSFEEMLMIGDSYSFIVGLLGLVVFIICSIATKDEDGLSFVRSRKAGYRWALYMVLIFCILCFSASGHANFIYNEF